MLRQGGNRDRKRLSPTSAPGSEPRDRNLAGGSWTFPVKQGRGRVVNLLGNDGVKPSYWEIAPGAAIAARQNLTLALAAQYGRDTIGFVAVNPGPVRTERWAGLVDAMARDMEITREEADRLAPRSIPLKRIAECEEVASLVAYPASDLAHFINGTMIEIDGARRSR